MKKTAIFLISLLSLMIIWTSCEDYVQSTEPLIDAIVDEALTSETQIEFLVTGLHVRFATTADVLNILSGLLSDELIFSTNIPGASYPTYRQCDDGDIELDNNSVEGLEFDLGELRFFADELVRRTGDISFESADTKNYALYWGNLFGGIARYMYATYFGLDKTQGGGVIDNGPFIASADMYTQAIAKMQEALNYTADAYEIKLANSLIARANLFNGKYAEAAAAAANGLAEGDAPFQAQYSLEASNTIYIFGITRAQFAADARYKAYIEADANEANRIIIEDLPGTDGTVVYAAVYMYAEEAAPINYMTWQENNLMLAELALRGQGSGDALALVNAVRAASSIDALAAVDLDGVYVERDKELFTEGTRLADQRRFDKWHLPVSAWQYLPITDNERNINTNF